ncbi:MAG: alpha/beta hydrolase, partial [Variovorax sp.]
PPPPPPAPTPEETRVQDSRQAFAPSAADAAATTFPALATASDDVTDNSKTSRWSGVLGGALYHVEVPETWNGKLVMYAHGYRGEGNLLYVDDAPGLRRYLIQQGYAWAASSYSKNFYDVRAGVEDTNALALEFNKIAAANGRALEVPTKIYIAGHSMGGHITAAAIDDETYAAANHKVKYAGALPMCGVVGDTELFDYFAAAQVTAQALAGQANHPFADWSTISNQVLGTLFDMTDPSTLAPKEGAGLAYYSVIQNLTGGTRPMYDLGFLKGQSFYAPLGLFGSDGTVNGILNKSVVDTNRFVYQIDGDTAASTALNTAAQKLTADADANRPRTDGLRWIPKTNGQFSVPVVTLHTLGDLFVPFSMEQIFNQRVAAKGNSNWLVQRAIRGITHCDFTTAEQSAALDAMLKWERDGIKPEGDDVVTPAVVAAPSYGCKFSNSALTIDDTGQAAANTRPGADLARPCVAPAT